MNMLDKFNLLLKSRNLNKRQFSLQSGIPYSTIDNWRKQGYENMHVATFKTLCNFFGVTMESMAYDDREIEYEKDVKQEFPEEENTLLRGYRAASTDTKGTLLLISRQAISASGERVETFAPSEEDKSSAG